MKDTIGELNMTVVTIVAIAALAGVFYLWIWPSIQVAIAKSTCEASCGGAGQCATITRNAVNSPDFDATACCTNACN